MELQVGLPGQAVRAVAQQPVTQGVVVTAATAAPVAKAAQVGVAQPSALQEVMEEMEVRVALEQPVGQVVIQPEELTAAVATEEMVGLRALAELAELAQMAFQPWQMARPVATEVVVA